MRTDRRKIMFLSKSKQIPVEFKRLRYVQNIKDAYINTGIICQYDKKYKASFKTSVAENSGVWLGANLFLRCKYDINKIGNTIASILIQDNSVIDMSWEYPFATIKVKDKSNTSNWKGYCENKDLPFGIFSFGDGSNGFVRCKIYWLKIFCENTLVRDYVPVKRIKDGIIGMYDLVEKKFYQSSNNTSLTGA